MEETFDPRAYATLPHFDVPTAIALGSALRTAAPSQLPPLARRELDRLIAKHASLEDVWLPIAQPVTRPSPRMAADRAVDSGWGALDGRLAAWERLPADLFAEVSEAVELRLTLFPTGLGFVHLPHHKEWAESQRRLNLIDSHGLAPKLDQLAGPAFLAAIRVAHARYGIALGITEVPTTEEVPASVKTHWKDFREAVVRYVAKLIGTLDDEDAAAVRAVKAALRPIDELRAKIAVGSGVAPRTGPSPTTTPAPEPEAEPVA